MDFMLQVIKKPDRFSIDDYEELESNEAACLSPVSGSQHVCS